MLVPTIGEHAHSGKNSTVCEGVVGLWTKPEFDPPNAPCTGARNISLNLFPSILSMVLSLKSSQDYLQIDLNEGFKGKRASMT